jgi:hypothetical protein
MRLDAAGVSSVSSFLISRTRNLSRTDDKRFIFRGLPQHGRMPMPAADLTPVERGVLFVLMAEGRPLKESSELKGVHGLALKPSHRSKLQRLGLIDTIKTPYFTHSLSEKGWQWARDETGATKPKGLMGMGALYSVLGGLRRHIEQHGYSLAEVFGKAEPSGADSSRQHMHEAAWSEADEALGQALQDIPVLTKAIEALHVWR